jgi:hypothetical protein
MKIASIIREVIPVIIKVSSVLFLISSPNKTIHRGISIPDNERSKYLVCLILHSSLLPSLIGVPIQA